MSVPTAVVFWDGNWSGCCVCDSVQEQSVGERGGERRGGCTCGEEGLSPFLPLSYL